MPDAWYVRCGKRRADRSYFIVHRATVEPSPRLLIFRDWLLEQARTTTEGTHNASRKTA